ncbi:hypothetical protein BDV95DRAFT_649757 [Massariosphaeria phaeospora]|uniref:Uncharacterized protein n=1 Tax=Massariosphaeria phaeospora TaxID=100035 RepID=A0A7C8MG10_9PLEO|nr:hypothetical protein BDV95DRAFT_649757 [Massariosphaeria phaeospora]
MHRRDGIRRTFGLTLRQFKPQYREDARTILIQVFHPSTKRLLGYLRFRYDKNDEGELEATNFGASLQQYNLSIGGTTKAGDQGQSGEFGEGLKLAALIFRRHPNNFTFRIESSSFKWNFIFNQDLKLVCQFTRIESNKFEKEKKLAKNKPRTTVHHAWEDVSVFIGTPRTGLASTGDRGKSNKIPLAEFRQWLGVTIDIRPPRLIMTDAGDLIMDKPHQGILYLRGLQLPGGSGSGKPYRYSYNFLEGKTNRERDVMRSATSEARQVTAIWAAAIKDDGKGDSNLISAYTDLLLGSINKYADVLLDSEDIPLSLDTATRIWAHMCSDRDGQGKVFYYCPGNGKDESHIIRHILKLRPIPIERTLWMLFRKLNLCRTPEEEQQYRFSQARIVEVPDEEFAQNVSWMLQCCIHAHPATQFIGFELVDGKNFETDAFYVKPTWKLNSRWFTYEGAHLDAYCQEARPDETRPFSCDHTVLWLWEYMIAGLIAQGEHPRITKAENWLKTMARTRLLQMPRSIKCTRTGRKGQLSVSWVSVDSQQNKDKPIKIVLHSDQCASHQWPSLKVTFLFSPRTEEEGISCDCPAQFSHVSSSGVTFDKLDPTKEYIPSVSRDLEGSFFGKRPNGIRPLSEDLIKLESTDDSISNGVNAPSSDPIDEDEMELVIDNIDDLSESASLYEDPQRNGSWSSSIVGPSITPGSALQSSLRSFSPSPTARPGFSMNRSHIISHPAEETYILGKRIEHGALDWGGSFPGSHNFYRTLNQPNEEVFIAKPKDDIINSSQKRSLNRSTTSKPGKQSRLGEGRAVDQVQASEPRGSSSNTPRRFQDMMQRQRTLGPSANDYFGIGLPSFESLITPTSRRTGTSSKTPAPKSGVTYRY